MPEANYVVREDLVAKVASHLATFAQGPASTIVVGGEPGIGKSTFTKVIADEAAKLDYLIASVGCGHTVPGAAFSPLVRLFSDLGLGDVFVIRVEDDPGSSNQGRSAVFESAVEGLRKILESRGLLLLVDDAHLADESSQSMLNYAMQELQNHPITLVLSGEIEAIRQSRELVPAISSLIRSNRCLFVELSGFDSDECISLVESTTGTTIDRSQADRLVELTGGNPFLIGHLARSGQIETDPSTGSLTSAVPPEVRFALIETFENLGPVAYKVLGVAALIGQNFTIRELDASVPDVSTLEVVSALEEGVRAGAIRRWSASDPEITFSHSLARDLLIADTPATAQLERIQRIVAAFEELHAHRLSDYASYLADKYEILSPLVGWDRFIEYSMMAGTLALTSHAYEHAANRFTKVLDLIGWEGQDRNTAQLLAGLAKAELHIATTIEERRAGFSHQRQAFDLLMSLGDHREALDVASICEGTLAGAAWNLDFLEHVVEVIPVELKGSVDYCRLVGRLGLAQGILKSDLVAAGTSFEGAEALALKLGTKTEAAEIAANRGSVFGFWHMRHTEGLESCLAVVESPTPRHQPLRALADAVAILIRQADQRVQDYTARLMQLAKELNDPTYRSIASVSELMWSLMSGELERAEEQHSALKDVGVGTCQLEAIAGVVALALGQEEEGHRRLNSMLKTASRRDQIVDLDIAVASLTLGYCARFYSIDDGRQIAHTWANQVLGNKHSTPLLKFVCISSLLLLGHEHPREAGTMLSQHRGEMVPFIPVSVDHLIGLVALDRGSASESLQFFDSAVKLARSRDLKYVEAQVLVDRVVAAGTTDSRRTRRIRELAGFMSSKGVTDRLAQATGRDTRPGGLTPREQQILGLMAQGMTNQEIADATERTIYNVQSHAYNIFKKLEVNNRAAAIRWAIDNGLI